MSTRSKFLIGIGAIAAIGIGGAAWWQANAAKTVPINDVSHIHGIAVDPKDSSRLYLATPSWCLSHCCGRHSRTGLRD